MRTRRRLAPFFLVLLAGCFSTIEPETDVRGTPDTRDSNARVRGRVLLFRGPGEYLGMPNHAVSVEWRDSQGVEVDDDVIKTGPGGNFEAWSDHPQIAKVELAALRCDFDPENGDLVAWDDAITLRVVPGAEVHPLLIISCETGIPQQGTAPSPGHEPQVRKRRLSMP